MKYVGKYIKEEWREPLKFYSFKCSKHGKVVNRLMGHSEKLICPICLHEINKERKEKLLRINL
jgi:hypothetical protein